MCKTAGQRLQKEILFELIQYNDGVGKTFGRQKNTKNSKNVNK